MILSALALAAAAPVYGPVEPVAPPPLTLEEAKRIGEASERSDWQRLKPLEITFQVLNLADFATTEYCLRHKKGCSEANPILGKNPSTAKLAAFKIASGVGHYYLARQLNKSNYNHAKWFEYLTIGIYGGVVVSNMTVVF